MPPAHRAFIAHLEAKSSSSAVPGNQLSETGQQQQHSSSVRSLALKSSSSSPLREAYNEAVHQLEKFRWGTVGQGIEYGQWCVLLLVSHVMSVCALSCAPVLSGLSTRLSHIHTLQHRQSVSAQLQACPKGQVAQVSPTAMLHVFMQ